MHRECDLSIITVNYNGLKDTCELIDTIPSNDLSLEVIVVDNGSTDNEAEVIATRYPFVKTIRSEKNLGFAGGNNLGIEKSVGKYLFLINNDTLLWKDEAGKDTITSQLQSLIDRLNSSPSIGIVCPKLRFAWGNYPIQFAGYTPLSSITMRNHAIGYGEEDNHQYDQPHPTPYAHGAAMMIKREALEAVGPMPECYFLYYEELDWSAMFTCSGYEIWYEPQCTVYHKESQATGQDSPLKTYYITRNRLLYVKRNVKHLSKYVTILYLMTVVFLRDIPKYAFRGRTDLIKAASRGIRDFFTL